jgi:steroid Delta-isomerase
LRFAQLTFLFCRNASRGVAKRRHYSDLRARAASKKSGEQSGSQPGSVGKVAMQVNSLNTFRRKNVAIETIINEYFAAISALDAERWVATFAEDATSYEPGNVLTGHAALRQFFNSIAGGFDRLEMKADQIFPVGNEAGVKWSASGAGRNGRAVAFEGVDVFVINEAGQIQTAKGYWNPAALMAELLA